MAQFSATWCGPCKKMTKDLEDQLPKEKGIVDLLAKSDETYDNVNIKDKIVFMKIDIDVLGDLADKYQVSSIPHTVLFKNGVEQETVIGCNPDGVVKNVLKLLQ